ncbi:AMP-binding protein [Oscillospiraceae bacterium WX1]
MTIQAPWLRFFGDVPHHLDYPDCSMSALVLETTKTYTSTVALDFFGCRTTYGELANEINACARALSAIGIRPDDRVTVCMPNTPQALVFFYAINRVGAVANMVHPLSAAEELVFFLNSSNSVAALTLDQFYPTLAPITHRTKLKTLIVSGIEDGLNGYRKAAYRLSKGRKKKRVPTGGIVLRWEDFLERGRDAKPEYPTRQGGDLAAILYSGGTTGTMKGILLTNRNFNALALQTGAAGNCIVPGHKMLAIMPIFHGFGLGVCIHTMLTHGVTGILVPQFTVAGYLKLLKKYKPHYIAGVPTLFEALLRIDGLEKLDMSQLEGVFCGGDTLPVALKRKVDAFLKAHGATVQVREGYGLTECVTASCLTPHDDYREGSIGIPFPDMYYKIVRPGTAEPLPPGEIGEICLTGPTVMVGYADHPSETDQALQRHPDGAVWLHTGDLGMMDHDGFVYFRQRIKRLIISSGYSIYPSQLENAINAHEKVLTCCVIGVEDPYKMQRVKAFVVMRDSLHATDDVKASILEHCRKHIARYAMPFEIEYRAMLPKTLVGKVAYTVLEREEAEKTASSRQTNP